MKNYDSNANTKLVIWFPSYGQKVKRSFGKTVCVGNKIMTKDVFRNVLIYSEEDMVTFENYNGYMNFLEKQNFNYNSKNYKIKEILFKLEEDKPTLTIILSDYASAMPSID